MVYKDIIWVDWRGPPGDYCDECDYCDDCDYCDYCDYSDNCDYSVVSCWTIHLPFCRFRLVISIWCIGGLKL